MPLNDVALTRRRQARLQTLREITATQLARRWLATYTDETRWMAAARLVLLAGQSKAVDLQVAHLEALLAEPLVFDRPAILAAARIDLNQPFIALANAYKHGADRATAVEAGRLRAEGVGESGVQWASRAANTAAEGHERIVGWTRTLGRGSCEWCVMVSTQVYRTAETASFGHLRCVCGVDPIIGDRDPGRALNARFGEG